MYFKFSLRKNPESGKLSGYYRLVESYRNEANRVCHPTILNVGFMEDVTAEQLNKIQKQLTDRYERKDPLFHEDGDPVVKGYVEEYWQRIVTSKKLDLVPAEKLSRMVNMDTLRHSDAREIGAENIVNAVITDFRALDTLGEVTVVVVAATGIASLILVSRRTGGPPRPGSRTDPGDRTDAASTAGQTRRKEAE